jgi:hypothetical protein
MCIFQEINGNSLPLLLVLGYTQGVQVPPLIFFLLLVIDIVVAFRLAAGTGSCMIIARFFFITGSTFRYTDSNFPKVRDSSSF